MKNKIILTLLFICLFAYLPAEQIPHQPGTRHSREEARQHYLQGKEFYSEGRYTEARDEFEKALGSIGPPTVGVTEKALQTPETVLAPTTPLAQTKEELAKKEEKEKEEKEKAKKEKEEKEKEEKEVTKRAVTEEVTPEIKETREREYYIDIGDVLDISVWQIPDLSKPEVIVRPDGKISFPLIGDIRTEGITLTKLDDIITEKLKAYVKFPEVSIMIRRFGEQTNKVVILGEIRSPGVYKFSGPPTITEVVASAGGYTNYAVSNSIMVIRGEVGTKPEVTRVNFARILKGDRLSQNIFLKPNDIIYVPRSFIGKINAFLEIIQPAISEYMQTLDARHFHNVVHRN